MSIFIMFTGKGKSYVRWVSDNGTNEKMKKTTIYTNSRLIFGTRIQLNCEINVMMYKRTTYSTSRNRIFEFHEKILFLRFFSSKYSKCNLCGVKVGFSLLEFEIHPKLNTTLWTCNFFFRYNFFLLFQHEWRKARTISKFEFYECWALVFTQV